MVLVSAAAEAGIEVAVRAVSARAATLRLESTFCVIELVNWIFLFIEMFKRNYIKISNVAVVRLKEVWLALCFIKK